MTSPPLPASQQARRRRVVREYVEALVVAVLLATFARAFVVQAFRIPTGSMRPSLLVGDHILVNKFVYAPVLFEWERRWLPFREVARGDVVVFRYPLDLSRDFVKRCVAVGGDRVRVRAKRFLLDGAAVAEPYVRHADPNVYPDSPLLDEYYRRRDNLGSTWIPAGHCFVLGDNRDLSNDSRFWGTVPLGLVRGSAWRIYWSVDPPEPGRRSWWLAPWTFAPGRLRWGRVFDPVR